MPPRPYINLQLSEIHNLIVLNRRRAVNYGAVGQDAAARKIMRLVDSFLDELLNRR